jgi:cysteine-rich secretory family protein
MHYRPLTLPALAVVAAGLVLGMPAAHADNKRLNESVVANVYTVQHQAGCMNDVKVNPQLQLAAEWHTRDVLNNRNLDGDIGSDGSTVQSRAEAAGYRGTVAETVAINPALAISGVELINQWYYNPAYFAIMANCANTQMGVWSENSLDRTVVVAVYGQPEVPVENRPLGPEAGLPPGVVLAENGALDPNPDYDASDEIEYGIDWFPWILRGVYPPPAYPPN